MSKQLFECADCQTVSTVDEFERTVMVDNSTGKGLHEECKYICPDCGSKNIIVFDSGDLEIAGHNGNYKRRTKVEPRIVITVNGGVVSGISANDPNLSVLLLDHDSNDAEHIVNIERYDAAAIGDISEMRNEIEEAKELLESSKTEEDIETDEIEKALKKIETFEKEACACSVVTEERECKELIACPKCGNTKNFQEAIFGLNTCINFKQQEDGSFIQDGERVDHDQERSTLVCGECGEELDEEYEEFIDRYIGSSE